MSIGSAPIDDMPKAPYRISDNVLNSVIELQEDKELQNTIKEYKAVLQALQLVNKDSKYIFEKLFVESKTKWEIINDGMSERTFVRRKSDLVYAVNRELKKMA